MNAICVTCGTQFGETGGPPERCPICDEERQYVGLDGQKWITLSELGRDYKTRIHEEEPGLTSFWIEPKFGIGQRSFFVQTPLGNVLWDCVSLLDTPALEYIERMGGIDAIAISHPHYYTCMVEWSHRFENAPIYLHADDTQWVMRHDRNIRFWNGESHHVLGDLRLVRCGGHFTGASVLHWPSGADGKGALLTGDTIQVVPDRNWVSFMYSYPNYIPINAEAVNRIVAAISPISFERIYGAFPGMTIAVAGKAVLRRSAARYLTAISAQ